MLAEHDGTGHRWSSVVRPGSSPSADEITRKEEAHTCQVLEGI